MAPSPASQGTQSTDRQRCSHRTAYFLAKRKGLSLLACTTGCGQPFWKDETGREIWGDELVERLSSKKRAAK